MKLRTEDTIFLNSAWYKFNNVSRQKDAFLP